MSERPYQEATSRSPKYFKRLKGYKSGNQIIGLAYKLCPSYYDWLPVIGPTSTPYSLSWPASSAFDKAETSLERGGIVILLSVRLT